MTDAELTVLSLVAEGARYGHEIQQIIEERGLREWVTIGFSSVYYILNKLEQQKLLTSELCMQGKRTAQKAYTLTEAGRGILQTAIADLLRQPRSLGTGFELGLANLSVLKPQQVYMVLVNHQQDLKQRLAAIEKSWAEHRERDGVNVLDHIYALYTHSCALMQAELQWLTEFLAEWERRYPAAAQTRVEISPREKPKTEPTRAHYHRSGDPAQMIQRLKRPHPKSSEEADDN